MMAGLLVIRRYGDRTRFVARVNGAQIETLSAPEHTGEREQCDSLGEGAPHYSFRVSLIHFGFADTPDRYLYATQIVPSQSFRFSVLVILLQKSAKSL